jgi:hypothetical protein
MSGTALQIGTEQLTNERHDRRWRRRVQTMTPVIDAQACDVEAARESSDVRLALEHDHASARGCEAVRDS